ncbi:DUF6917 domain-containing protein [Reinekea forsetii]|jgi:hypothetical protein|uniref:DUF6917 domain-containing protein n=1 Tax=Reinekea forsetii TaxID=1336806 RepID=A0A2K8KT52_9GAMM|nr:hypothetical protein [Reinekea forsetii]ATX77051.1 hypothetical protein REIFOR_01914 [Reinekea forsetii]
MQSSESTTHQETEALKTDVQSQVVKKLFHKQESRGMTVIEFASRCVRTGEVHELVTTTHKSLATGDRVDQVGFLGFVEILNAGVLERGDHVTVNGNVIGTIAGFDDCHFPNHYNILIETETLLCATDLELTLAQRISFNDGTMTEARSLEGKNDS